MKKRRILICIICLLFIIIGAVALRFRGSHVVSAKEDVVPAQEIVLYRQDDERWADETLGNSGYTMGKSGCLVSCIASAVTMTKEEKTPHTLNEEFSAHSAFDAEGNILWDALRNTGEYEVDVFKDATEELLIECLRDGRYPIARVRMYGLGNFHYVLIVKAENGEFFCMDPLEDELTTLSRYANRIYAVRCVSPAEYTGETEVEDEAAVSESAGAVFKTAETEAEILAEENSIDTDDFHDSEEAFLTDLDIHPLYAAFLRNEISVPNPFMTGSDDSDLSYDYYYLDGDETTKCILQSNEEYENQ